MEQKLDMREIRRIHRPKLSGKRSILRVELDTEVLFQLRVLKGKMRCKNWEEFIKKILEKEEILTSDDVAY